jgi:hypothetical protein
MTEERCNRGHTVADLVDYWIADVDREQAERIEQRIFECAGCGECLADIEAMSRGVSEVVRGGRFHSILTESLLNRLSRDGMRIRTYTLERGAIIPCAVWADDDLIVSRLRADFTGVEQVTVALQLESGDELSRVSNIPIAPGQTELLDAVSADRLRQLPPARLRLVLTGTRAGKEHVIGEYGLEHAGNMAP